MSSFIIKIIAIVTMLMDHSGDVLVGHLSILNIIGRIAFPLFAFQLVIGYQHTRNFSKYCLRLFIFALISQIPFGIMCYSFTQSYNILNVFFTLVIGVLVLKIYDCNLNYFIKLICIIALTAFAQLLNVDYQAWGVILVLFIYIFYNMNNKILFIVLYPILCIIRFIPYFTIIPLNILIWEIFFTIIPLFFMLLYNNKKGPSLKYFFYIFYPIHIIILDIILALK